MKKSILNLGKALNKLEQKQIKGGRVICCYSNPLCPSFNQISCIVVGERCILIQLGEGPSC